MVRGWWVTAATILVLAGCGDHPPAGSDAGAPVGSSKRIAQYLRSTPFDRLWLELDAVPGHLPADGVERDVLVRLATWLDKPGGISIIHDGSLPSRGSDHLWNFVELDTLARQTLDLPVDRDTLKMHVLMLDGGYVDDTPDSKIIGLAWGFETIALFEDSLQLACGGSEDPQFCRLLQATTWLHEVGHLLGLVNSGTPMVTPHEDVAAGHSHHCDNPHCLMYWTFQTSKAARTLREHLSRGGTGPPELDTNCKNDLAAVRGEP